MGRFNRSENFYGPGGLRLCSESEWSGCEQRWCRTGGGTRNARGRDRPIPGTTNWSITLHRDQKSRVQVSLHWRGAALQRSARHHVGDDYGQGCTRWRRWLRSSRCQGRNDNCHDPGHSR